jgi:hypothetical protein
MIYRTIFKNAWQILWKAKYLWVFGLFSVLVSNSGEVNLTINNLTSLNEQNSMLRDLSVYYKDGILTNFNSNLNTFLSTFNTSSIFLIIGIVIGLLALLWLAVVSKAALVSGSYKEYRKQTMDFKTAFKTGYQNFWKFLGVIVLGKLFLIIVFGIFGLPLAWAYVSNSNSTLQIIFTIISFIILVPLAIVISFLVKYAEIFIITEKEKTLDAIRRAWKVFKKNWVASLEMAILVFLITLVVGIGLFLSVMLLAIPVSLLFYVFYLLNIKGMLMLGIVMALLLFILLVLWIGAMLSVFRTTAWVILADRLNNGVVLPKLMRWVGGVRANKDKEAVVE